MSFVYSASEVNLTRSKLVQLALHLEVADKQRQYDFTRIAIIEMISSYEQELLRSQQKLPDDLKKRAKVRRWQIATQSYLKSLDLYLFQMDSGVPLDFLISRQNKILILIGQQPVIISGPNSGGDKYIEKRIVEHFCEQNDCREYFCEQNDCREYFEALDTGNDNKFFEKKSSHNIIYSEVTGSWLIDSDLHADFVSSNGVIFKFSSISQRHEKEAWALQISHELVQLSKHIKQTQNKGIIIKWLSLNIDELPLTDNAHKITINSKGDFIKLYLPALGKYPALFIQLKPWLQSQFENKIDYRIIEIDAEQYY